MVKKKNVYKDTGKTTEDSDKFSLIWKYFAFKTDDNGHHLCWGAIVHRSFQTKGGNTSNLAKVSEFHVILTS